MRIFVWSFKFEYEWSDIEWSCTIFLNNMYISQHEQMKNSWSSYSFARIYYLKKILNVQLHFYVIYRKIKNKNIYSMQLNPFNVENFPWVFVWTARWKNKKLLTVKSTKKCCVELRCGVWLYNWRFPLKSICIMIDFSIRVIQHYYNNKFEVIS